MLVEPDISSAPLACRGHPLLADQMSKARSTFRGRAPRCAMSRSAGRSRLTWRGRYARGEQMVQMQPRKMWDRRPHGRRDQIRDAGRPQNWSLPPVDQALRSLTEQKACGRHIRSADCAGARDVPVGRADPAARLGCVRPASARRGGRQAGDDMRRPGGGLRCVRSISSSDCLQWPKAAAGAQSGPRLAAVTILAHRSRRLAGEPENSGITLENSG